MKVESWKLKLLGITIRLISDENQDDGDYFSDDTDDPDDPEYQNISESEESEEDSFVLDNQYVNDDELQNIR